MQCVKIHLDHLIVHANQDTQEMEQVGTVIVSIMIISNVT